MAARIRKALLAGNWKMNKTSTEASDLARDLVAAVGKQTEATVVLCPPFTALAAVAAAIEGSTLSLGAQNLYPKANGAYTGEISPLMLRGLFCQYVILGHSERRTYFSETDAFINQKVLAALENSLKPILCVGETLAEREAGQTLAIVDQHVREGLKSVGADKAEQVVIAYEPVWAIGTGKTATPEMAQEVHGAIRQILTELYGEATAQRLRILYGGSMNDKNAAALLAQPDIDGGLIGGASLDPKAFVKIVEAGMAR